MARGKSAVPLSRTEILMPTALKDRIKDHLPGLGLRNFTDFIVHSCEKTLKTAKAKKDSDS